MPFHHFLVNQPLPAPETSLTSQAAEDPPSHFLLTVLISQRYLCWIMGLSPYYNVYSWMANSDQGNPWPAPAPTQNCAQERGHWSGNQVERLGLSCSLRRWSEKGHPQLQSREGRSCPRPHGWAGGRAEPRSRGLLLHSHALSPAASSGD